MDTLQLIIRIGCVTFFILAIVVQSSLCKVCNSESTNSMDDDKMHYDLEYNSESVMILPAEAYCFVDDCTIRIIESNELLNVVNSSGGWIVAANTTNLFTTFVNDSQNNCSLQLDTKTDQLYFDTASYVIRMIVDSIAIIAAIANVSIHLMFKELRTVSGILIMMLCISLSYTLSMDALRTALVFYHQVITTAKFCAVLTYLSILNLTIYEATKTTVLAHFAYTMYKSYNLLVVQGNKKSMLCKYITFIVGASTISCTVIITVDVANGL